MAYDQRNNEYLVVWQDDEMGIGEFEIWGQRVEGATGWSIGSDMGQEGDADQIASAVRLTYLDI